jgi:hypothetical protein
MLDQAADRDFRPRDGRRRQARRRAGVRRRPRPPQGHSPTGLRGANHALPRELGGRSSAPRWRRRHRLRAGHSQDRGTRGSWDAWGDPRCLGPPRRSPRDFNRAAYAAIRGGTHRRR